MIRLLGADQADVSVAEKQARVLDANLRLLRRRVRFLEELTAGPSDPAALRALRQERNGFTDDFHLLENGVTVDKNMVSVVLSVMNSVCVAEVVVSLSHSCLCR